jgi:inner membrane protein
MLARAGLGRFVPRAGLLMMVAANAPDVDVISSFGGTATYLREHRGITHSFTAVPVVALLAIGVVWMVARKRIPFLRMWLLAIVAVLSHLVLDWTNSYGIRLLLPFSGEWFRLDSVFVIDFLIWGILLLGVVAPALGKLVSSEIGARAGRGTGWAVTVLALLIFYEGGRYLAHDRALATLNSRIYNGAAALRSAAFADGSNPLAWIGVVETANSYIVFNMNLRDEFDPGAGHVFYKAQDGPAIEAARRTEAFQTLERFSNWTIWRVTPAGGREGGLRVQLIDLRFGTPAAPGLQATALVDETAVRDTAVGFRLPQPR